MRRIKADIFIDKTGEVCYAYAKGWAQVDPGEDYSNVGDGYIQVPLKKATSRNKGNSLERDVAKAFSQWLYGRQDILARTPLSGGWEGSKLGDITANPAKLLELKLQMPQLYVECKNREGILSESFFNWMARGTPKMMTDLITDTVKKAGMQMWFLVLKSNGTDPWVFTNVKCDPDSAHFAFRFDNQSLYSMFPLKQLGNVFMYSNVKQVILS